MGDVTTRRTKIIMHPFVITVESIAGGTVKEACRAAVDLANHLNCIIRTEINDVEITVGGNMTGKDVYEQWLHHGFRKENEKD